MNGVVQRPHAFTMHSPYTVLHMDGILSCSKEIQTLQETTVLGLWKTLGTYCLW